MSEKEEDTRRYRVGDSIYGWVARVGVPAAIAFVLLFQTNVKQDRIIVLLERLVTMSEAKR
jgi:hypothetical protein